MKSIIKKFAPTFALLAIGYSLGVSGTLLPGMTNAQPNSDVKVDLSIETIQQVQAAHEALAQLTETMKLDGKYTGAAEGLNPYLVLSGGGNAIEDLEQGTGVDPITFAALYAGNATQEVQDELSRDEDNRLLYKNKLVRIYSVEKLTARKKMLDSILNRKVNP